MNSIDLIRENLRTSEEIVLARIADMRDYCMVAPTPRGGCHTLWILGHIAYIERQVIRDFMLGEQNPLDHWKELFDGADVSYDANQFPSFDEVLIECRTTRRTSISIINAFVESDLDRTSSRIPKGAEGLFGTYRQCLQYVANHWFMHRGQLADARRAAGLERMWF